MIIVIEGVDQSGKHTQSIMLSQALDELGIKTKVFSFPDYDTPIGKIIKQYLVPPAKKRNTASWPLEVIHCLQAANKWEHLYNIKNATEEFDVVIMNRYTPSNYVYGMINGVNPKFLENIEDGLPTADHTILLDLPIGMSFSRNSANRDKFEQDREFLDEVRNTYVELAKKRKWKKINADRPENEVHDAIMDYLAPVIKRIQQKSKNIASTQKRTPAKRPTAKPKTSSKPRPKSTRAAKK